MKCKLNDLCFVIKSKSNGNLGKIVQCTEYLGYLSPGVHYIRNTYLPVKTTKEYWLVTGNLINEGGISFKFGAFSTDALLPIPTEPIEDSEISSKELEFN